jgi:hypothetical protein
MMFFLIKPVIFFLQYPVGLSKTKYGYHVVNITELDIQAINTEFGNYTSLLKVQGKDVYMNGLNALFYDKSDIECDFVDGCDWYIRIQIQGYKYNMNSHKSPVWKLMGATKCF